MIGDLAAALSHGPKGTDAGARRQPGAPSRWGAPPRRTSCAACAANRRSAFRYIDYGNLATVGRKAAVVDLAVPPPRHAALQRPGRVAVLAVRAHLLPDRLSQPADGDGRLGLGVLHVRARRAGRRRAGVVAAAAAALLNCSRQQERDRMDTRTSPARLRIEQIQDALRAAGCAAVVVPSSDPHLSEYLPERWQARQWASGFTGSMATLIVTTERAALFADSRYWVQAESQLAGSGIELVRIPTPPRRAARRLAVRERRARRDGRRRRRRHRPGGGRASCARRSRSCGIDAAQRPRRRRRGLARPPDDAGGAGLRAHRRRGAARRAPASSRRCARRCATPARRTT